MKLLNVGCGRRLHMDWVNLDVNPSSPEVHKYNVLEGIPFPGETFDVVYHSHVLEHVAKNKALTFMKECFRVLKPRGIIRVVVPDLEAITRLYLKALEKSLEADRQWQYNYEWLKLEMYDQTVRERSGGEMQTFLHQVFIPNKDFVLERIGVEGKLIIENHVTKSKSMNNKQQDKTLLKKLIYKLYRLVRYPVVRRASIIRTLFGKEYELLQLGRFRRSGEIHLWMYDRYSLAKILDESGFTNPIQMRASESQNPNWVSFNLDTEPDMTVYKPDSLYMEATKP